MMLIGIDITRSSETSTSMEMVKGTVHCFYYIDLHFLFL